jgi:hypothetical protein
VRFHVELRHFPANFARFNLTEAELGSLILQRWAKDEWVEIGDRKWNPQEAKLTVLEGPELTLDQLTMGRGWRNAQRHSREVTETVLTRAREQATVKSVSPAPDLELQGDSLGLELLAELGDGRVPLHRIWELAEKRGALGIPSQSLALAERAVYSLLRSGLIVILTGSAGEDAEPARVPDDESDAVLRALASWASRPETKTIWISRS